MVIVAFSINTSKVLPNIICRGFKHVALIVPYGRGMRELIMYQFTRRGNITRLSLRGRDLSILRSHGWRFVYLATDARDASYAAGARTCVGYVKRRIGITNRMIQTPMQLYKYLN